MITNHPDGVPAGSATETGHDAVLPTAVDETADTTQERPVPSGRGWHRWRGAVAAALVVTTAAGWAVLAARREEEARQVWERREKEAAEAEVARQRTVRAAAGSLTQRYSADPAAAEQARIAAGWADARRRAQTDALLTINAANPFGYVSL